MDSGNHQTPARVNEVIALAGQSKPNQLINMEIDLENWELQPQECEGTYRFDGRFFVTRGVKEKLSDNLIASIYLTIKLKAQEENGIDYAQVLKHQQTGEKLFFIDQINDEMKASGGHSAEHNYCTLMFSYEY